MRLYKILIYEFLLVFTSLLIFGSFRMVFDGIFWMNQDIEIVVIVISFISLTRLNKIIDEKIEKPEYSQ